MSTAKKNMLDSERAFLIALSARVGTFTAGLTYRETRACGLAAAQVYQVRRGEPVNFTALTIRHLALAMGTTPSELFETAEQNAKRK